MDVPKVGRIAVLRDAQRRNVRDHQARPRVV